MSETRTGRIGKVDELNIAVHFQESKKTTYQMRSFTFMIPESLVKTVKSYANKENVHLDKAFLRLLTRGTNQYKSEKRIDFMRDEANL